MKRTMNILAGIALSAMFAACEAEVSPLEFTAPEVSFPDGSETISATVGVPVEFNAEIQAGDRLVCSWYVDDVQEASSASFTYTFDEPGTYTVRFEARNGAGVVEHTYTVNVTDVLVMTTSVGDSTVIERYQNTTLKVMAIVAEGSDVTHSWSVDGVPQSTEAYFDTFVLAEARTYTVSYVGTNAVGRYEKSFDVNVLDAPLEVVFSPASGTAISVNTGETVQIAATVVAGETGIEHSWSIDDSPVSTDATFSHVFDEAGQFTVTYSGTNAKDETASGTWTVTVTQPGFLFDDFETVGSTGSEPGSWWVNGNDPGITIVDNPFQSGINTSETVMRNYVNGTGSTSGYFTLKLEVLNNELVLDGNDGVANYTGLRFKMNFGTNEYYPRIDYNGSKYFPVSLVHQDNEWVELIFDFGQALDSSKDMTIRPLLDSSHQNISGSNGDRTVYFDDFELLQ